MAAGGFGQAMQAAMAAKDPTSVEFGGSTFRVLPPMQWRQSAMTALYRGDFNSWAVLCMVNDEELDDKGAVKSGVDDGALFVSADFTFAECAEFMGAYERAAGQAPGE